MPFSYVLVSSALSTRSPVLLVVAAISSTTASLSVSGRPRHVCVMWQNNRCSILFHFDVPGGYRRRIGLARDGGAMPDEIVRLNQQMAATRRGIGRLIDSYAEGLIDK